jgi:hypothetical protein
MPVNQMELWCAEPHLAPRLYPQLSPEQRNRLILQMVGLMLKQVRNPAAPTPPLTPTKTHER